MKKQLTWKGLKKMTKAGWTFKEMITQKGGKTYVNLVSPEGNPRTRRMV